MNGTKCRSVNSVLMALVVSFAVFTHPVPAFDGTGEAILSRADGVTIRLAVDLALKPESRGKGLMHRQSLPADQGMWFDFGTDTAIAMWMKDTSIPLDMIFINAACQVVDIAEHTTPFSTERIRPVRPARYVLEVVAGTAQRLALAVGDRVLLRR